MFGKVARVDSGWQLTGLVLLAFVVGCGNLSGGTISITDSGQGWIESDTTANGNSQTNNYTVGVVGKCCSSVARNHFDFAIPDFAGVLTSVTLNLFDPIGNANAGPELYSLYSLGAFGSYGFSGIGTGSLYGNATITAAENNTTVDIPLNSAALAAVTADQGGIFSLGGKLSDEITDNDFVFGSSTNFQTSLTLTTTSVVPEPSGLVLSITGLAICALRYCEPSSSLRRLVKASARIH